MQDLYEKLDLKGNAWDRRIYQEVTGIYDDKKSADLDKSDDLRDVGSANHKSTDSSIRYSS